MIAGNPHIKTQDKPSKKEIMSLTIDKEEPKKVKTLSPEEIEQAKQELLRYMNK